MERKGRDFLLCGNNEPSMDDRTGDTGFEPDPELDPELDDGPKNLTSRARSLRRCLATGDRLPQNRMIRFVVDPSGMVTPDLRAKLPGRGMWVGANRQAVERAVRKSLFAKTMRRKALASPDLPDRLERLLSVRCVELLSLTRRAGQAVAGFEKARAALRESDAAVLLTAADGARDGRRKLLNASRGIPVVDVLARTELALAFGRADCVHAVLKQGGLAEQFIAEASRLSGFRAMPPTARANQAASNGEQESANVDSGGAGVVGGKG